VRVVVTAACAVLFLLGVALVRFAWASEPLLRRIHDERVRKGLDPLDFDGFAQTHKFMYGIAGAIAIALAVLLATWILATA
jgi:hypothetical protein